MRRGGKLLAAGLTLWLLVLGFQHGRAVRLLYPTVSLRYDQPVSREQVAAAWEYSLRAGGPWPTFWGETSAQVQSGGRSSQATQILFQGEAHLACPAEYCYGREPSTWEKGVCAVSKGLAWSLWGSECVVGLELTVDGTPYRVTGVFSGGEPQLLRPGQEHLTAVELSGMPAGEDGYELAGSYAQAWGLDAPNEILWGPGFAKLAQGLVWLPLTLAGLRLACACLRQVRRLSGFWRNVLGFGAAFLLALALPALLTQAPPWLLPTRWSDFPFWSRLWESLLRRCRDLLALTPQSRDVAGKTAMVHVLWTVLGACVTSGWLSRPAGPGSHGFKK